MLISRIASIIIGIIGIIGMTIELSKLIEKKINGITDFGVGITLLVIWGSTYYYFNHPICNFLILFLLLLGCYGCLIGIDKILESIKTATIPWTFKQIGIMIANCAVFLLTVLQIIQIITSKD